MKFDILTQQNLYKGFFRVDAYEFRHELFAGGWSGTVRREIFERRNAVAVLLHDPVADTLLVIEQFRPGAALRDAQGAWMVEIVAGIVESGESNEDVARREAQEEAGCTIDMLEHIIDFYPSAGGSTEIVSLYYAPVDLSAVPTGIHGLPEEHEDIRVSVIPRHTALAWLKAGKIQASLAIIALQVAGTGEAVSLMCLLAVFWGKLSYHPNLLSKSDSRSYSSGNTFFLLKTIAAKNPHEQAVQPINNVDKYKHS